MTSGTPGWTSVRPRSATMRTTSAMCSGSQAISVRMDQVPTCSHSPPPPDGVGSDSGPLMTLSPGTTVVSGGGGTTVVSGGGATPLSGGTTVLSVQVHTMLGKSSCSATASNRRASPSMVSVTGVAPPTSRTILAACLSASAVGDQPSPSTESASCSNRAAVSSPPVPFPGLVPLSPQPATATTAASAATFDRYRIATSGCLDLHEKTTLRIGPRLAVACDGAGPGPAVARVRGHGTSDDRRDSRSPQVV